MYDVLDERVVEDHFKAALEHENTALAYERDAAVSKYHLGPFAPTNLLSIALVHRTWAELRLIKAVNKMP